MYWYVSREGRFDETQMRLKTVDEILVVDRDVLRAAYGAQAELPLFVLDSINIAPEPTPTPEPTEVAPPSATPTP
jgi:hypothetical protein